MVGRLQGSDNPLSLPPHSCPLPAGPVGSTGRCSTGAAQGNGPVRFKVLNTAKCHVGMGGSGGKTPRTQSPHCKRLNVQQNDPVALPGKGTLVARDGSRTEGKESTTLTLEWGDLTLGSIAREHVAPV